MFRPSSCDNAVNDNLEQLPLTIYWGLFVRPTELRGEQGRVTEQGEQQCKLKVTRPIKRFIV